MADFHPNLAISQISVPPSGAASAAASGSAILAAGTGIWFASPPFEAIVCPQGVQPTPLNAEAVRVIGQVGDVLTIGRQQEGSSRRAIASGDAIFAAITRKTLTDIEIAPLVKTFIATLTWPGGSTLSNILNVPLPGATGNVYGVASCDGTNHLLGTADVDVHFRGDGTVDLRGQTTGGLPAANATAPVYGILWGN